MTYEEQQAIDRKAREDAAKPWFHPNSGSGSSSTTHSRYGETYEAERKRLGN